tara:strand:+ start:3254 stop:3457 length:204 start_codon:yes stop_codon:yes gene_type:complete
MNKALNNLKEKWLDEQIIVDEWGRSSKSSHTSLTIMSRRDALAKRPYQEMKDIIKKWEREQAEKSAV